MTDKERLEEIKELVKKIESILYDKWRQQELTNLIESLYYADHINWLINRVEELEQVIGDLDENVAAFETLWLEEKRKNQLYKQTLEYIQREIRKSIYTPKKQKWNSDFEREFEIGKTRGLIQASDIVKEAIEILESEE